MDNCKCKPPKKPPFPAMSAHFAHTLDDMEEKYVKLQFIELDSPSGTLGKEKLDLLIKSRENKLVFNDSIFTLVTISGENYIYTSSKTSAAGYVEFYTITVNKDTGEYLYDPSAKDVADDYLKAADKTELEGKIALKADESALEEVSGKVTALEGKVGAADDAAADDGSLFARIAKEVADRKAADSDLSGRVETLENAKVAVDGKTILRAEDGTLSVGEIAEAKVTGLVDDLAAKAAASDVTTLQGLVGTKADESTADTLFGKVAKAQAGVDANAGEITTIKSTIATGVVKGVKINGGEETLPLNDGIVDITVPTGALASKDKIGESDVEETLLAKINKAEFISAVDTDQLAVAGAKLRIKAVSTDLLAQGSEELVLDGGKAA